MLYSDQAKGVKSSGTMSMTIGGKALSGTSFFTTLLARTSAGPSARHAGMSPAQTTRLHETRQTRTTEQKNQTKMLPLYPSPVCHAKDELDGEFCSPQLFLQRICALQIVVGAWIVGV